MTTNRQRLPLLDGLRGFSLLSMAGFHLVWDLIFLCGRSWLLEYETALYLWQQSICWSFIFLSGFSWPLSRRPVRRGAVVFFCGAVITAASCVAMPMNPICFGILTFLGSAMILLRGLHPILRRLPAPAGLAGSLLLFFLLRGVNDKALGFPPFSPLLRFRTVCIRICSPPISDFRRRIFYHWIIFLSSPGCSSTSPAIFSTALPKTGDGSPCCASRRPLFSRCPAGIPFSFILSISPC